MVVHRYHGVLDVMTKPIIGNGGVGHGLGIRTGSSMTSDRHQQHKKGEFHDKGAMKSKTRLRTMYIPDRTFNCFI